MYKILSQEGNPPDDLFSKRGNPVSPAEKGTAFAILLVGYVLIIVFSVLGIVLGFLQSTIELSLVFIAIGFVGGLPFLIWGRNHFRISRELQTGGKKALGTVRYKISRVLKKKAKAAPEYIVAIEFSPDNSSGQIFLQSHRGWFAELSIGDRVELIFHPVKPEYFKIQKIVE